MKTFNEIKNKVHDASGIDNPQKWLWEMKNNIYYPVKEAEENFEFILNTPINKNPIPFKEKTIKLTKVQSEIIDRTKDMKPLHITLDIGVGKLIKPEQPKVNAWDFVEKYYPNYFSSNKIAEFLYLDKWINERDIKDIKSHEADYYSMQCQRKQMMEEVIHKTAIEAFLEQEIEKEKTTATITWSIADFESKAEELFSDMKDDFDAEETPEGLTSWEQVYDESKFSEALKEMVKCHDANYGITWSSIEYYLDEYCRIENK